MHDDLLATQAFCDPKSDGRSLDQIDGCNETGHAHGLRSPMVGPYTCVKRELSPRNRINLRSRAILFRSRVAERRGRQGSGRKFPKHDFASYSGGQQKLGVGEGQADTEGAARRIEHAIDRGDGRRIGPSDGRFGSESEHAGANRDRRRKILPKRGRSGDPRRPIDSAAVERPGGRQQRSGHSVPPGCRSVRAERGAAENEAVIGPTAAQPLPSDLACWRNAASRDARISPSSRRAPSSSGAPHSATLSQ